MITAMPPSSNAAVCGSGTGAATSWSTWKASDCAWLSVAKVMRKLSYRHRDAEAGQVPGEGEVVRIVRVGGDELTGEEVGVAQVLARLRAGEQELLAAVEAEARQVVRRQHAVDAVAASAHVDIGLEHDAGQAVDRIADHHFEGRAVAGELVQAGGGRIGTAGGAPEDGAAFCLAVRRDAGGQLRGGDAGCGQVIEAVGSDRILDVVEGAVGRAGVGGTGECEAGGREQRRRERTQAMMDHG
ncbi:MAG: hypothetical protein NVV69_09645 [Methyloversatilis sp.]|uniref:hypothetical protein n=1 Tax=Methyloversatilis sp. TaxID=2569862 RepID=UPI0026000043|nr:hypothetical protein [Methyloversatilis sp.]MCR6666256.1 hypothetical protein [Methyloversatilis sp.]